MHYYKRVKHLKFFKITRSRFFSMECCFKDSSSLMTWVGTISSPIGKLEYYNEEFFPDAKLKITLWEF